MKKKINRYLLLTAFLTLAATLFMAVAVFHHMYRSQIIHDMQTYAEILRGMAPSGEALRREYASPPEELRVTVIDPEGVVLFDSQTGSEAMDNHAGRPEIQEALDGGEGYVVRHSDTLDRDMYYYALTLEDGDILRISREADSIWRVFYNTTYGIVAIGAVMFLICLFLSRYITAGIVRPIERLAADIDHAGGIDAYEELVPFITTIRQQHSDILRSANMRQEFTANVSHELKTPLTAISGYAELIETGIAGENEVSRFAGEIHRNANRLLTLINDTIRLSELDGGHAVAAHSEVDLHEVAESCVEMLEFSAADHGVSLHCHGSRCLIHADRGMMEELLFNLCDNAIRYNRPGGRVDVTAQARGAQTVLPGGQEPLQIDRRHRPGPGHRQAHRGAAPRPD